MINPWTCSSPDSVPRSRSPAPGPRRHHGCAARIPRRTRGSSTGAGPPRRHRIPDDPHAGAGRAWHPRRHRRHVRLDQHRGDQLCPGPAILDPDCPAAEIVRLYHDRWEIEPAFLELKQTILGGRVLRARTPTGVEQEIYALLLTCHAAHRDHRRHDQPARRQSRILAGGDPSQQDPILNCMALALATLTARWCLRLLPGQHVYPHGLSRCVRAGCGCAPQHETSFHRLPPPVARS
ncbi:MAG: transposase [Pseudonocardiaceae bacterium]